jgi:hypothetical protein
MLFLMKKKMKITSIVIEDTAGTNQLECIQIDEVMIKFYSKFNTSCLIKQTEPHQILFKFPNQESYSVKTEEVIEFLTLFFNEQNLSFRCDADQLKTQSFIIDENSLLGSVLENRQYFIDFKSILKQNCCCNLSEFVDTSVNQASLTNRVRRFKIEKFCKDSEVANWETEIKKFIDDEEKKKLKRVDIDIKRWFGFSNENSLVDFITKEIQNFFQSYRHHICFEVKDKQLSICGTKKDVVKLTDYLNSNLTSENFKEEKIYGILLRLKIKIVLLINSKFF